MKNIKISESELKRELDKLRSQHNRWTPEIDKLIIYARENIPTVNYVVLAEFIHTKFGWKVSGDTIRKRYTQLRAQRTSQP